MFKEIPFNEMCFHFVKFIQVFQLVRKRKSYPVDCDVLWFCEMFAKIAVASAVVVADGDEQNPFG